MRKYKYQGSNNNGVGCSIFLILLICLPFVPFATDILIFFVRNIWILIVGWVVWIILKTRNDVKKENEK
jgi:hypothetical protein